MSDDMHNDPERYRANVRLIERADRAERENAHLRSRNEELEAALRDVRLWLNGDKYRFSHDPDEVAAWEHMTQRIDRLLASPPDSESAVNLEDVITWADGIRGDLGTENARKVTRREAAIAQAIVDADSEPAGRPVRPHRSGGGLPPEEPEGPQHVPYYLRRSGPAEGAGGDSFADERVMGAYRQMVLDNAEGDTTAEPAEGAGLSPICSAHAYMMRSRKGDVSQSSRCPFCEAARLRSESAVPKATMRYIRDTLHFAMSEITEREDFRQQAQECIDELDRAISQSEQGEK